LRRRYLVERARVADIAREAGVNIATVYNARRAAGIPARGKADGHLAALLDPEWLRDRRGEGLSWYAIAAQAGMDRTSVLWQAAGCGLYELDAVRYQRAVRAAKMYRRGHTLADIAAAVGVDRRQVTLDLRALNVEIRRRGRQGAKGAGTPQ
jgi:transposase-like protein